MIEAIVALLFGLVIGSFLNVCIHRLPRGRSVIKPRSHCVRCRKRIAWYDNVPIVSYALLRGRCRHCGRPISIRYPAVELITGLLFLFFVWTLGPNAGAFKMCLFGALMVGLIFCDLEKRLLPDEMTLGGLAAGIAFAEFVKVPDITSTAILAIFGVEVPVRWQSMTESLGGALLPSIFLWGGGWIYERLRHREGLGLGDVKLIAMAGSFLGLRHALLTLILGSVAGTILGYGYIKVTGKDASTYPLPFGTFLGVAAIALALAGQRFLGWYPAT
ncbi:MAG TPA: prepilin peptidase [Bryobacteraceae bacterium]|nr:prepilin peptidase [Bryobacteraceae bacterium]